jgi:hypothetical protein
VHAQQPENTSTMHVSLHDHHIIIHKLVNRPYDSNTHVYMHTIVEYSSHLGPFMAGDASKATLTIHALVYVYTELKLYPNNIRWSPPAPRPPLHSYKDCSIIMTICSTILAWPYHRLLRKVYRIIPLKWGHLL